MAMPSVWLTSEDDAFERRKYLFVQRDHGGREQDHEVLLRGGSSWLNVSQGDQQG